MGSGPTYSMDDRERAVAAYVVGGTFAKAETITGINSATIRKWKSLDPAWWAETEERVRVDHEQEHRAAIRDIIVLSLSQLRDRVEHGDYMQDESGEYTKRKPMAGKELVIAAGVMVDKLRVSLGHPTSIAGKADNSALNKLDELRKAATTAAKEQGIEDGSIVDISEVGRGASSVITAKNSEPETIAA